MEQPKISRWYRMVVETGPDEEWLNTCPAGYENEVVLLDAAWDCLTGQWTGLSGVGFLFVTIIGNRFYEFIPKENNHEPKE